LRVLITGSAGFIGYHLCKSMLDDGYEILGIDNINDYYDQRIKNDRLNLLKPYQNYYFHKVDICDRLNMKKLFKSFKPQKVVNLAAQVGVRNSLHHPYSYLESNLIGFINLIELCKEYEINGLIYASSSSVYGEKAKIPFNINENVDKPLSFYAATKKSNELIAHSYSHIYNINTTGLRYFTVYGPWGRPDMATHIFINNIINRKPINVFNNGNMKRDFTFIDDIIDGTRAAIDKNYKCEIFNLGYSTGEKLMDLINLIEDIIGIEAIIDFQPIQPGDVIETCADIEYSFNKIGFKPKTSIDKGINRLIEWHKEYYNV